MTIATPITADSGATTLPPVDVDLLIVGAGISGIGMAVHMQMHCPGKRVAMVEARAELGGTWDLFRYPGIRSDSDMFTLGFGFEPWRGDRAIADGGTIRRYLNQIVDDRGLRGQIRFGTRVLAADWDSAAARWTVTMAGADGQQRLTTRFLYMGSGYYDYEQGHDVAFPGRESFTGQIIHPQFWPQDADLAAKQVVVIGSGATAITLVPSIASTAAHVTMLQRTPSWYFIRPSRDWVANGLRRILPEETAYRLVRWKNITLQGFAFRRAMARPRQFGNMLMKPVRRALGGRFNPVDFTPPYNPWEQRICLVPDSDFFAAITAGQASIVTDRIDHFDAGGIVLASGQRLDADVIVTATGLKLAVAGKVAFRVDGRAVHWPDHIYYKNCMFSGLPNLAMVFGYVNASWTLRADLVADYICRVIRHMDASGAAIATPTLPGDSVDEAPLFAFSSGYLQRADGTLPKNGAAWPWQLSQDYRADKAAMAGPVDDGVLRLEPAPAPALHPIA